MFPPEDRSLVSVQVPSSNSLVGDAVLCELNNLNSLSTQDNFQLVLKVLPAQLQLFVTLVEKHHFSLFYIRDVRKTNQSAEFREKLPQPFLVPTLW